MRYALIILIGVLVAILPAVGMAQAFDDAQNPIYDVIGMGVGPKQERCITSNWLTGQAQNMDICTPEPITNSGDLNDPFKDCGIDPETGEDPCQVHPTPEGPPCDPDSLDPSETCPLPKFTINCPRSCAACLGFGYGGSILTGWGDWMLAIGALGLVGGVIKVSHRSQIKRGRGRM